MKRPYIGEQLREMVRQEAKNRCGYCLVRQDVIPIRLTIEHIIPISAGGSSDEDNLWLSCSTCNTYKGEQVKARDPKSGRLVPLFNPRRQNWFRHFCWSRDGTRIIGRTATGRATVEALQLNNELSLTARRFWVLVGEHPPEK